MGRSSSISRFLQCIFALSYIFLLGNFLKSDPHKINVDNTLVAKNPSKSLFVLVISNPRDSESRQTARDTWLHNNKNRATHRFAVCRQGLDNAALDSLRAEDKSHADILWLDGCKEEFTSLTTKVGVAFTAVHNRFEGYKAVLKVDDDTFARLDLIQDELSIRTDTDVLYWGYFDGRAEVRRYGKYKELAWNSCDTYLPYAVGGGYLIGHRLVRAISQGFEEVGLRVFNAEDVSVGLWLASFEAVRWHDVRFDTEWKSRGCQDSYLVLHKRSAKQMKNIHSRLAHGLGVCETPGLSRVQYEYNWDTKPSQCCPGRGKH